MTIAQLRGEVMEDSSHPLQAYHSTARPKRENYMREQSSHHHSQPSTHAPRAARAKQSIHPEMHDIEAPQPIEEEVSASWIFNHSKRCSNKHKRLHTEVARIRIRVLFPPSADAAAVVRASASKIALNWIRSVN